MPPIKISVDQDGNICAVCQTPAEAIELMKALRAHTVNEKKVDNIYPVPFSEWNYEEKHLLLDQQSRHYLGMSWDGFVERWKHRESGEKWNPEGQRLAAKLALFIPIAEGYMNADDPDKQQ
jgi:hypothetical protein